MSAYPDPIIVQGNEIPVAQALSEILKFPVLVDREALGLHCYQFSNDTHRNKFEAEIVKHLGAFMSLKRQRSDMAPISVIFHSTSYYEMAIAAIKGFTGYYYLNDIHVMRAQEILDDLKENKHTNILYVNYNELYFKDPSDLTWFKLTYL